MAKLRMTVDNKVKINIILAFTGEKIVSIIVNKNSEINKCFNEFIITNYYDNIKESDIKIIYNSLEIYSYYYQLIGNRLINEINLFENNKIKEIEEIQEIQDIQEIQEIKEIQEIQEIQDIQEIQEIKEIQEIQEIQDIQEIQEIQEICVLLVFADKFIYISEVIINQYGEKTYNTESYQKLNDCKKKKINKLLDILHEQEADLLLEIVTANIEELYNNIIITKFIVIILLKKGIMFNYILINQLNENFGNDREVVEIAVSLFGYSLYFASIDLRGDKKIVEIAVSEFGASIKFASIELRNDRNIVEIAVSQSEKSLRFVSRKLRSDKKIVEIAVSHYGYSLCFASRKLRADRDIVSIAVLQCKSALRFASIKLRNDKDIIKLLSNKQNNH